MVRLLAVTVVGLLAGTSVGCDTFIGPSGASPDGGVPGPTPGDAGGVVDAAPDDVQPPSDAAVLVDGAPAADAAPVEADAAVQLDAAIPPAPISHELTQSASQEITDNYSILCGYGPDNDGDGVADFIDRHAENHYYRVFDLDAAGIASEFDVQSVRFAVEGASSPTGTIRISVFVHIVEDPANPTLTTLVEVDAEVASVEDQVLSFVDVPVSARIPAGAAMVVEVATADARDTNEYFRIGMNAGGQNSPSYIYSPSCGATGPDIVDLGAINGGVFADRHLIINVTGEELPAL